MFIIKPVPITDAQIVSTNLTENDAPAYNAGSTYAAKARVIYQHQVWEALVALTAGITPGSDATKWYRVGVTNPRKPFDSRIGDPATHATTISYVIDPGQLVTALVFLNLAGETLTVTATDPVDGEYFSDTKDLIRTDNVVDAWTYFFSPFEQETEASFLDLGAYPNATFEIEIAGTGAQVGEIVMGDPFEVGGTCWKTKIGWQDFSDRTRDQFGVVDPVIRDAIPTVSYAVSMPPEDARRVQRMFMSLRGVPVVTLAGADLEHFGTTMFGLLSEAEIPLDNPTMVNCFFENEGLV